MRDALIPAGEALVLDRTQITRRRFLSAAMVTLVGSGLAACGFGQDQISGRIGQPLTAGDYQLLATGMENPAERPDRFTNPTIGNRFVKLDVVVTNGGQQHLPVAATHFTLKDSGGIDNAAKPGIPSDRGLRMTSLSPGQKLEVPLYFEMAANLQPAKLVFTPSVVGWRTRIEVDLA